MAGSGVPLLSESLIYDHRGKVVREIGSSTDMAYTGLGHLKRMFHSPGIVPRPTHETLEPNGLGLVLRDSTWVQAASDGTPGGSGYPDITAHNASYGPGGRLAGKTASGRPSRRRWTTRSRPAPGRGSSSAATTTPPPGTC